MTEKIRPNLRAEVTEGEGRLITDVVIIRSLFLQGYSLDMAQNIHPVL